MHDDLAPVAGERLALLRRLGFGALTHDSHVPFLSHLIGTRRLLVTWGERPALCDAGLFHSVYGTEYFEPSEAADPGEVRSIIGDEAEAIARMWCVMRRDRIDLAGPTTVDRVTGETIDLDGRMLADIATLWSADTVEQIERMEPDERDFARSLRTVLHLASPAARDAVHPLLGLLE